MNAARELQMASSRDRILRMLLYSEEPATIPSLARKLGISRNATHQHVVALERDGLIERAAQVSTRGRPSQAFRLSDAGRSRFPRQYALLARKLVEELSRLLEGQELKAAMRRIGGSLADELDGNVDRTSPELLDRIAGLMHELGYEARLADSEEQRQVVAHNCVFHDLAYADPGICEVDLELLRRLSGQDVEHRECMARGGNCCRFSFTPRSD